MSEHFLDAGNDAETSRPAESPASTKLRAVPVPCPGYKATGMDKQDCTGNSERLGSGLLPSSAAPIHASVPTLRPPASGPSAAPPSPTCQKPVTQKHSHAPMSEEACSKAERLSMPTPLVPSSAGQSPAPVQQQQHQQADDKQLGSYSGIDIPIIAIPIGSLGQPGQRSTSSTSFAPAYPAVDSGAAIPRPPDHRGTPHIPLPVMDEQQTAHASLTTEDAGTMLAVESLMTVVDLVLAPQTSSMPLFGTGPSRNMPVCTDDWYFLSAQQCKLAGTCTGTTN